MSLKRTTLRLDENLKREAELKALRENTTLQTVFNDALARYLEENNRQKARKLVFATFDLGTKLDNLTRDDYYDPPGKD